MIVGTLETKLVASRKGRDRESPCWVVTTDDSTANRLDICPDKVYRSGLPFDCVSGEVVEENDNF